MTVASLTEALSIRFGLRPRSDWPERLRNGIAEQARKHGLSQDEVMRRGAADPNIARELAARCVVAETYFMRPPEHFAFLVRELPKMAAGCCGERLRLWSAGCSTGQEPYSVAMVVEDVLGPAAWAGVEILATDVSAEALSVARRGLYGRWALRGIPDRFRSRFFTPSGKEHHALHSSLRERVSFHHLAIQEHACLLGPGTVDVVLFHNVGVYLTSAALRALHCELARVLKDGGMLMQAITDPEPDRGLFQRVGVSALPIFIRARVRSQLSFSGPAFIHGTTGSARGTAARELLGSQPSLDVQHDTSYAGSATRAARGEGGEDAPLPATHQVNESPRDSSPLLARAHMHLSAGRHKDALADLRGVVFLAPDDHVARFWYAVALVELGETRLAIGQLRRLSSELEGLRPDSDLSDGAASVEELASAVNALMGGLQ